MATKEERRQERKRAVEMCPVGLPGKGEWCLTAKENHCTMPNRDMCPAYADYGLLADVFSIPAKSSSKPNGSAARGKKTLNDIMGEIGVGLAEKRRRKTVQSVGRKSLTQILVEMGVERAGGFNYEQQKIVMLALTGGLLNAEQCNRLAEMRAKAGNDGVFD